MTDAPPVTDERIAGLQPYVQQAKFYQGAGTYVPPIIPLGNYLQELVITKDTDRVPRTSSTTTGRAWPSAPSV